MRPTRLVSIVLAVLTVQVTPAVQPARAVEPVSIELLLALDVSLSVDEDEYELQREGLAQAFRRTDIIKAIAQHPDGVAVAVIQWSDWTDHGTSAGWRKLTNAASVATFADELDRMERVPVGVMTRIGSALMLALRHIEANGFDGAQRKIDVSGDGQSNAGPAVLEVRDRVLNKGITINGLAILTDDPELDACYRRNVIGGAGAFVVIAESYDDFAEAIARKLLEELSPRFADLTDFENPDLVVSEPGMLKY